MKRFITLGLCLLLIACTGGTSTIQDPNLRSGTRGVTAKFLDSPQQILYANSPAGITYEIANEGAALVDEGIISIGVEDALVELQGDRVRTFALQGKSTGYPTGDKLLQSAQLHVKQLSPQTTAATTTIALNVCYPYQTIADTSICLDTDTVGLTAKKPCTSKAISLSSQGAPIAVTKIEPILVPHEKANLDASFIITLQNSGNGQTYAADKSAEACAAVSTGAQWNTATLQASIGDSQLTCDPLKFENRQATVRCVLPGGLAKSAGTYTTTMTVQVNYGYTFTVSKQLQIKRLS